MEQLANWGYLGLFLSGFISGSIIPANSEIVLSAALAIGLDTWLCVIWATLGNLFGGISCYYIGYFGKIEWITKYMRVTPEKVAKMQNYLQGKGAWWAFFVFIPFLGDLSIVVFGILRSNFAIVAMAMLIGKFLKYLVWVWFTLGILSFFQ